MQFTSHPMIIRDDSQFHMLACDFVQHQVQYRHGRQPQSRYHQITTRHVTSSSQHHAHKNERHKTHRKASAYSPIAYPYPLSHSRPIKLGRVPDSTQHDEARRKVIPENIIKSTRSHQELHNTFVNHQCEGPPLLI